MNDICACLLPPGPCFICPANCWSRTQSVFHAEMLCISEDLPLCNSQDVEDDVLSVSAMSIASSSSLASEVYERARRRRDEFWGKPRQWKLTVSTCLVRSLNKLTTTMTSFGVNLDSENPLSMCLVMRLRAIMSIADVSCWNIKDHRTTPVLGCILIWTSFYMWHQAVRKLKQLRTWSISLISMADLYIVASFFAFKVTWWKCLLLLVCTFCTDIVG